MGKHSPSTRTHTAEGHQVLSPWVPILMESALRVSEAPRSVSRRRSKTKADLTAAATRQPTAFSFAVFVFGLTKKNHCLCVVKFNCRSEFRDIDYWHLYCATGLIQDQNITSHNFVCFPSMLSGLRAATAIHSLFGFGADFKMSQLEVKKGQVSFCNGF